uniref:AlNc14C1167G12820 protein n=1 Tax=Albugo laibachii Nc14 TaxID=890382 RepID=F0X2K1_9STRA|nr:AlNc14C1167G12820 [Albugo laibachii Nc14]|eukprot:CCA28107.1 AlNc14C1167G12820 [Albugo laibachii Nc14]
MNKLNSVFFSIFQIRRSFIPISKQRILPTLPEALRATTYILFDLPKSDINLMILTEPLLLRTCKQIAYQ